MLEIKANIVSKIGNDAEIRTLLNSTNEDSRVYSWNPAMDVAYSEKESGAIFYNLEIDEERPYFWTYPSQVNNMYLFFRVLAINQYIGDKISERLITLFDLSNIKTTNWRIPYIELVSYREGPLEGTPSFVLFVRNTVFFLKTPLKR